MKARSFARQVVVVALALVIAAVPFSTLYAGAKYTVVSREVVLDRLKAGPKKDSEREAELGKLFRDVGCQPTEQPVKGLNQPNIICVLPGASDSIIVVGGHFDHVDAGDGIVDDWSGAALLPSLYQSLVVAPRLHTFVFIGFSGEEQGLVGSGFYTRQLSPAQRKQIAAVVNLECLGVTSTKVWTSHSEPSLVKLLVAVARSLQLPLAGVDVEEVGTADSESFAHYKIPRITIHSVTPATWSVLHSNRDNITAIHPSEYYDSYRLIAAYLASIDSTLNSVPAVSEKASKAD